MGIVVPVELVQTFGLVLARVASLFLTAPGFSQRQIPVQVRVALTFAFTCIFVMTVPTLKHPLQMHQLVPCIVVQMILGFLQGLAFAVVLAGLVAAGDILDLTVGYAFASTVDPGGADTMPHALFSRLFQYMGVLIFLALGGHLWVLGAMVHSLQVTALDAVAIPHGLLEMILTQSGYVLRDALQMAAPIVAFMGLIDLVSVVVTRAVPTLQIMTVAFPVKITLGLLGVVWFLPAISDALVRSLQYFYQALAGGV